MGNMKKVTVGSEDWEVFFVRNRYWVDSFTDFWGMVVVNDFPICFTDEIEADRKAVYILPSINGEFYHSDVDTHIDNLKNDSSVPKRCVLVWMNLERQSYSGLAHLEDYLDAVWTGCRYYETVIAHPRCLYVPLGSEEGLCRIALANHQDLYEQRTNIMEFRSVDLGRGGPRSKYDFLHLSYLTHRRSLITGHLPLSQPPNGHSLWGLERHEALKESRFMLHIHQDDLLMQAPLKSAICAAYALPLIHESTPNPLPMVDGEHYYDVGYDKLLEEVPSIVRSDYRRAMGVGSSMWRLWTKEFPFSENMRRGIIATLENPKFRLTEEQWRTVDKE